MNFNILKVKEGKSVRDPHTASHLAASANIFLPTLTPHTVPHVTIFVSKGKFTSGLDFFLSPPENKKAFAL